MLQELDELHVRLLRRNIAVDQAEAECESGALAEIRLNEGGPLSRDRFGDFSVAVAGKIREVHLGLLAVGRVGDGEEIDGASASGRGGDFGLL